MKSSKLGNQSVSRSSRSLVCVVFFAIFSVVACGPAGSRVAPSMHVASDLRGPLLPPKDAGMNAKVVQEAEVLHLGAITKFTLTTEYGRARTRGVATSPSGEELFSYNLERKVYLVDVSSKDLTFNPERILGDLQIIHYPLGMVARQVSNQAVLVQERDQPTRVRTFFRGEKKLLYVKYSNQDSFKGKVLLKHREEGYELRLETKSVMSLP